MIGDPSAPLRPATDYPALVELTQQFGAGLPLYVFLMGLTVLVLRVAVAKRRG
jgi:hypothetical protein